MTVSTSQPHQKGPHPAAVLDNSSSLVVTCDKYLALVHHEVASYAARLPKYVDVDELAGAAVLGLVEAASRFDTERGVPFEPWARQRIRGAILDAARKADFASRGTRSEARAADSALEALTQQLGRTPSAQELAVELGISTAELSSLRAKVHAGLVTSLDAAVATFDDDESISYVDTLVDADLPALELLERRELDRYVKDAVALLPDRLRMLIDGYYYGEKSSADLAEELGVTESRISQLRSEALRLLKEAVSGQYEELASITSTNAGRSMTPSSAKGRELSQVVSQASSYVERISSTTTALL